MHHRLIMFTGSTSGAGKSTLSDFLYRQFHMHGIPARWTYEEDFVRMDALIDFNRTWEASNPAAADALLDAARSLFASRDGAETWITDTLFPGFFWLLGRLPMECVERFSDELWSIAAPLEPLIVYLDADVRTAFERAVAYRGEEWGNTITGYMRSWPLPHYPDAPLRNREDVLRFETWVNDSARRLLAKWQGRVLTIDTAACSLQESKRMLLGHFGLREIPEERLSIEELKAYEGIYQPAEGNETAGPLRVSLAGDSLVVNRFWPNGCRLNPDGPARFRLQAASRTIEFEIDAAGTVIALTYGLPNASHRYTRKGA